MPATPTEPGWYPDPWGTDGERRFDGTAWGRETRPGPGAPAPPVADGGAAPALPSAQPPAAWYPDPAGSGGLRYWDGSAWTAHTAHTPATGRPSGSVGADAAALLASERSLGRVARVLLLAAGPALAAYIATTIVALHAVGPQWRDAMARPGGSIRIDPVDVPAYIDAVSNLASLVLLASGIVFILWLGRAGRVALAAGRTLRRGPWLGAWSFAIPIVHWWWPYRATRDLLGDRTGADARLVARWWTLWIVATTSQLVIGVVTLLGAPPVVTGAATVLVGIVAVAAAVLARAVIATVARDHAELLGVSPQA
jgi:hypothetical protein